MKRRKKKYKSSERPPELPHREEYQFPGNKQAYSTLACVLLSYDVGCHELHGVIAKETTPGQRKGEARGKGVWTG